MKLIGVNYQREVDKVKVTVVAVRLRACTLRRCKGPHHESLLVGELKVGDLTRRQSDRYSCHDYRFVLTKGSRSKRQLFEIRYGG